MSTTSPLLQVQGLTKDYGPKTSRTRALGPVDFTINRGSYTVILGKSGSGKSTLLNLLAGLDSPTSGKILVNDRNIAGLSAKRLAKYRAEIGIIFQFYNLLPTLTTIENVLMGSWAGGTKGDRDKARQLLDSLGLAHREDADVTTLSGGEKQRVAIARALIDSPQILFCDEPTGALDSKNERQVRDVLDYLHGQGITIVMVTHNEEFAARAEQVIYLQDGKLVPYAGQTKTKPLPAGNPQSRNQHHTAINT